MTPTAVKLITAAEFAQIPEPADGSKEELVRGVIVTMPAPGFLQGMVQATIGSLLYQQYARSNRNGRVTFETGLQTEFDPVTVRGPHVAFWSAERLPLDQTPQGYPDVAADLVVEIPSPSSRRQTTQDKIREYLNRGVRMVWIVDPEARTVTVYRQPGVGRLLWYDATLTGEEVLPGFQCHVAEFFE